MRAPRIRGWMVVGVGVMVGLLGAGGGVPGVRVEAAGAPVKPAAPENLSWFEAKNVCVFRLGNGPMPVTADELSQVDAGFKFTSPASPLQFPFRGRGVRIPRLRDLLVAFRDELVIIELKGTHPIVAERTFAVVRETDSLDRVCFGGFSWKMLRTLRKLDPRACSSASREETRWALYGSWLNISPAWARSLGVRAFQIPEMAGTTRVVSPRFLEKAHAADLLVQVWTVNEEADMRRLAEWGVDGLITDRPDRARQLWPVEASRQSETAAR